MLPKAHRLRHERDIKALFAKSKGVFDIYVPIRFAPNKEDVTRIAVVAGIKVSKKAVIRNRIKRRVRAQVHAILDQLKPGYDVAILIKKDAIDQPVDELRIHLEKVLKKAGLL